MNEEESAKQLIESIDDIYKPGLEEDFFKNIISAFYLQGTDSLVVEKIVMGMYQLLSSHQIPLADIIAYLDDVYSSDTKPTNGTKNFEKVLQNQYDGKTALKTIREINKVILMYDDSKVYKLELGTDRWVVMNNRDNEIQFQSIKTQKGGNTLVDFTRVLLCYPTEIIIHDNPISELGRTFSISWTTSTDSHFLT